MTEATHAAKAAPAPLFPREIRFARLPFSTRFAHRAEFDAFLKRERELWAPLQNSPHHSAQNAARQNIDYLDQAQRSTNEVAASNVLTLLENEFIPLSIGPGTLLAELSRTEPETTGAAIALCYTPDGRTFQPAHPSYAPGQAIRLMLQIVGSPSEFRQELDAKRLQLQSLATDAKQAKAAYEAHIQDSRAKIEALATQAALKAPREYWEGRRIEQRKKAKAARWVWLIGTFLFCAAMVVAVVVAFSPAVATRYPSLAEFLPVASGQHGWLTALVPRLVFLGTLAGVGVWLIRQFLRDVRNHEHLAEDAAERVTMIETLGALQAFGLRNDDLSTILSALYRPAAAAMADDGGPVLPIEVLMKGVADAASRGRA